MEIQNPKGEKSERECIGCEYEKNCKEVRYIGPGQGCPKDGKTLTHIRLNGLWVDLATLNALKNFKKNNGRDWRWKLCCAWGDGAYESRYSCTNMEAGILQRLRNRPDMKDNWLDTILIADLQ